MDGTRKEVPGFRDLEAWKRAMQLTVEVYHHTRNFPGEERFGLVSQVRRSAGAVAANIAEGSGRRTTRELLQALGVANGELKETESHLELAYRLGYVNEADLHHLCSLAAEVGRLLTGLRLSLKRIHP